MVLNEECYSPDPDESSQMFLQKSLGLGLLPFLQVGQIGPVMAHEAVLSRFLPGVMSVPLSGT